MSFCSDDQHTTNRAAVTSPANSGETDKASPVITVKPNFVAFFVLSGTASFSFIGENFSFVTEAIRRLILLVTNAGLTSLGGSSEAPE